MKGLLGGLVLGMLVVSGGLAVMSVIAPPAGLEVRAPGDIRLPEQPQQSESDAVPADTPTLQQATAPDEVPDKPDAAPTPDAPPSGSTSLAPPAGSEFSRPPAEGEARLPATDPGASPGPGSFPAPAPSSISEAAPADTSPAAAPQTGGSVPEAMTAPEPGQEVALATPGMDAGIKVPGTAPEVATPDDAPTDLPQTPPAATPQPPAPEPAPEPEPEPAPEPEQQTAPAATPEPESEPQPDTATAPRIVPEPAAPRSDWVNEGTVDRRPAPAAPAEDAAETAETGPDVPAAPVVRRPAEGREIALPGVPATRLPGLAADAPAAPAQDVSDAAEPARLGALSRYAVPFEPAPGKPLFSVILLEAEEGGLDRETLTTFTFPVTFAVDPGRPDAAEAIKTYRDAGFEVVLLATDLPEGATPRDLEITLAPRLDTLPGSVAVMDLPTGGLGADRQLLRQLMSMLKDSGHGIISYDRGLNAAEQIASVAGVPGALVFRELDTAQESVPTIRRYLDRAAFKALQDGQVIMVGRSYPATVTALFSWAIEGKGAEMSMAPVSAILRGQ